MKRFLISTLILSTSLLCFGQNTLHRSIFFDGVNDFVAFDANHKLDFGTESFSYQFSFMPTDLESVQGSVIDMLVGRGVSADNDHYGYFADIREYEGKKVLFTIIGSNNVRHRVYGTTSLENNTWYNGAIVVDRSSNYLKLYLDGVLQDSTSIKGLGTVSTHWPTRVGNYIWPTKSRESHHYAGGLDDLAFWDKALTSEEVMAYYKCPPVGEEEGLRLLYRIDGDWGNTISDWTSTSSGAKTHMGVAFSNKTPINCHTEEVKHEPDFSLKIYPNPSEGEITVELARELPTEVILTVTNAIGQIVYKTKFTGNLMTVDLPPAFSSGIYVVQISNPEADIQLEQKFVFIRE